MDKRTLVDKLKALQASPSCCPELKQAVNAYFVALAAEQVAAKNLIAELEDDVVTIDELIEFVHSPELKEYFKGNEALAKIFADNAEALKTSGAKYCNCFACTVGLEILDNRDVLLS